MKSNIGKRVMALVFGPFLLIMVILSAYTSYTVIQNIVGWTELELKGITDINAAQLEGRINSVRITVLSAAETLGKIDGVSQDARTLADETVRVMFINESVYNAWLVYEPDAFDGCDAAHTRDYPGAPSGRFMLSYVMEDGEVIVAPDMDESIIDDPAQAPWYAVPRDDGRLYIDVANNVNENLYDYGVGGEPVYTLSVVAPLYRDGQVIGCVGADVLFDTMTFGIDNAKNAAVAVFYPDGRVFYAEDIQYAEDSIDTLSFMDTARIKRAMAAGESFFLPDERCMFLDERAFVYFHPVRSEGMDENALYLYVALPRPAVLSGLIPVLAPVAVIAVLFLSAICMLYVYALRRIFQPVRQLTLSADAISQGDLQTGVTIFSKSEDEIGTLSRSLHRMVEQFRVYIFKQDQIQEETILKSIFSASAEAESPPSAYAKLTAMLRSRFHVNELTLVLVASGKASVVASCKEEEAEAKPMEPENFIHHAQVISLLVPHRRLAFLNKDAMNKHKLAFIRENTVSVCIVPIWSDSMLRGYMILGNNSLKITFKAGTESTLLFVSQIMPEWLAGIRQKEDHKQLADEADKQDHPEEPESGVTQKTPRAALNGGSGFMEAMGRIDGLYADTALEAMGGLTDIYERSVKILTRTAPETIARMDDYLQSGDIPSFAIEVHGMKGAFHNIGATELAGMASQLERIAKAGGTPSQCTEHYGIFRERMTALLEAFSMLPDEADHTGVRLPGDKDALAAVLQGVNEAALGYDSLEALELLTPLLSRSYGEETDTQLKELADLLEQFECERALEKILILGGNIDAAENK